MLKLRGCVIAVEGSRPTGSSKSRSLSRILSEFKKVVFFWFHYKQQVNADSFARTYRENPRKHGPISFESQNRVTLPPFWKALQQIT